MTKSKFVELWNYYHNGTRYVTFSEQYLPVDDKSGFFHPRYRMSMSISDDDHKSLELNVHLFKDEYDAISDAIDVLTKEINKKQTELLNLTDDLIKLKDRNRSNEAAKV